MQVAVNRKQLDAALDLAVKAVKGESPHPIYLCVLLEALANAEKPTLRVTGSDGELGLEMDLPAEVEQPGVLALEARLLREFVSRSSVETVRLGKGETDQTALVAAGAFKGQVAHQAEVDLFPAVAAFEPACTVTVPAEQLLRLVRQTKEACDDPKGPQPLLAGILLRSDGGSLLAMATDRKQGAVAVTPTLSTTGVWPAPRLVDGVQTQWEAGCFQTCVPLRTMELLEGALREAPEGVEVTISATPTQVSFEFGDVRLVSSVMAGTYPNLDRAFPTGYVSRLTIDRQHFMDCLRRALVVASRAQRKNLVTYEAGGLLGGGVVSASAEGVGETSDGMDGKWEGEGLTVSTNGGQILTQLASCQGKQVTVEFNGPASAIIIRQPEEEGVFFALVMPTTS